VTVRAADLHRSAGLDGLNVEFVTTDVLDPDGLTKALDGTDVVFHLAAMISIAGDPRGLVRQLDEDVPRTVDENTPAYDRSKFAGEQAILAAEGDDVEVVIVNPSGIIGPHDYGPSRMGETIVQLRDGKVPVNVGGGFDFVDARDVADGMIAAANLGRHGVNGGECCTSGARNRAPDVQHSRQTPCPAPSPPPRPPTPARGYFTDSVAASSR